jgi:N-acetylglucosaminyldiphosphoundecaprenol N-acetyl-beta-D-mannosaminyltransferase
MNETPPPPVWNPERQRGTAEMKDESRPAAVLADIRIANLTLAETLDRIEGRVRTGGFTRLAGVNAAILVEAERHPEFHRAITTADFVTADGMSVVWASRCVRNGGSPLVARVATPDIVDELLPRAVRHGWRVFLLGAGPNVADTAAARLRERFPGLALAGARDGYFEWNQSVDVAEAIRAANADLLLVGMGSPRQELWLAEFGHLTGAKFALGVGGVLDILAGRARRAPRWMQYCGLEWFYRLIREPRRLWRRYLVGNVKFAWLVARKVVSS